MTVPREPHRIESIEPPDFPKETLSRFLEQISAKTPAPGGGAVAAVAAGMAAGLAGMAARFAADELPAATELIQRADAIRSGVAPLAGADAASYEGVLRARRTARDQSAEARERALRRALSAAADVPLSVAGAAAETADIAARLAEGGNSNLKGDAAAGAILAEAAARISAVLVNINLAGTDDDRIDRVRKLEDQAADAARQAVAAASPAP